MADREIVSPEVEKILGLAERDSRRKNPVVIDVSEKGLQFLPVRLCRVDLVADLFAGNNSIKKLPEELCNLFTLTALDVRNNQIKALPDGFSQLKSLEELYLVENRIRYIPDSLLCCTKGDEEERVREKKEKRERRKEKRRKEKMKEAAKDVAEIETTPEEKKNDFEVEESKKADHIAAQREVKEKNRSEQDVMMEEKEKVRKERQATAETVPVPVEGTLTTSKRIICDTILDKLGAESQEYKFAQNSITNKAFAGDTPVEGEHKPVFPTAPMEVPSQLDDSWWGEILDALQLGIEEEVTLAGWDECHTAAATGDLTLFKELAEQGSQLDTITDEGWTSLDIACRFMRASAVHYLIQRPECSSMISHKDRLQLSALHHACLGNASICVPALLRAKIEIDSVDSFGNMAIHYAADANAAECMLAILKNAGSNEAKVERLLSAVDTTGSTALHRSVLSNSDACCKILCSFGADTSTLDEQGYTPLHLASAMKGSNVVDVALSLINSGAEINTRSADGASVLEVAIMCGNSEVARALIEHGADVSARAPADGTGPLHVCAKYGNSEISELILSGEADINMVSTGGEIGQAAIHIACLESSTDVLKLLCNKGANVNIADVNQWTPIHYAASVGFRAGIQILVEYGASVTSKTKDKQTALKLAAAGRHESSAMLLLQAKEKEMKRRKKSKQSSIASSETKPEESKDKRSKMADHRQKVLEEVLSTEQSYVRSLNAMVKIFLKPMKRRAGTTFKTITPADFDSVFSNIESLLEVNKMLLEKLEERFKNSNDQGINDPNVGDIFEEIAPFLKVYSQYVNEFDGGMETLKRIGDDPDFVEFCEKTKSFPECANRDLQAFLIMPVQRVPRYVLLLSDLLKNTDPAAEDYSHIEKSLTMIKDVGKGINESKGAAEASDQLVMISQNLTGLPEGLSLMQPGRRLVRAGALAKKPNEFGSQRGGAKKRVFVLFTDLLMYCKGHLQEKLDYRGHADLMGTAIQDIVDGSERGVNNGFRVRNIKSNQSFVIISKDSQEKAIWMSDIRVALDELTNRRQSLAI